jgi:hypothetical protein
MEKALARLFLNKLCSFFQTPVANLRAEFSNLFEPVTCRAIE